MIGPFRSGTLLAMGCVTHWERRVMRGHEYCVITEFDDADGAFHAVGESWFFLGSYFWPYDDLLTVLVAREYGDEWKIPLCWRVGRQEHVCEKFGNYVRQTSTPRRDDYFSTSICADCHQPLDRFTPKRCLACNAAWD